MQQLENTLDLYLRQKAPALPTNIKELIVSFAPWISIIMIVLGVPALLAVIGISAYVAPWAYWAGAKIGLMYYVSIASLAVTLLLRGLALPGLFARTKSGWKMLYYSIFVDLVYSLLSYLIVGGLIEALVSLYFLFQVREYYK